MQDGDDDVAPPPMPPPGFELRRADMSSDAKPGTLHGNVMLSFEMVKEVAMALARNDVRSNEFLCGAVAAIVSLAQIGKGTNAIPVAEMFETYALQLRSGVKLLQKKKRKET